MFIRAANFRKLSVYLMVGLIFFLVVFVIQFLMAGSDELNAIYKLHTTGNNIVKVSESNDFELYMTKKARGKPDDNFIIVMNRNGWNFVDQNGSGYVFEKDGNKVTVTTKIWFHWYFLIKIPNKVANLEQ
jgi:hypothetical protein